MEVKFKIWMNALPSYNSNEAAITAGLAVGRAYWAGSSHNIAPQGRLMKVV